ncbi:hypothetical protein ACHAAC_15835 [Aeromicrobium sp. CF4.19]|uniref:hypothetical protein n=1 Tax=Aeromicrobium sp. CF4.19 TaxID=3373082 RepID=UPI003EE4DF87
MRRPVVVLVLIVLALTACTVPQQRDDDAMDKLAAESGEVTAVFERYRAVRNTAVRLLDAKPLSTVEVGPVLDIDTGSFEVAERLSTAQAEDDAPIDVREVVTPRFSAYPLWFMAVVRDEEREVNRVQVFERDGAAAPWLLVSTPETVLDAELPELRERDGGVLRVDPEESTGMAMSAQAAADAYAAVLEDPQAQEAALLEEDGFIDQMRATAAQNADLAGVTYEQQWSSQTVRHVLRTADGGALAFIDLERSDTYEVEDGVTVTWPEDSPQQAFIPQGISTTGTLLHHHQVLVHLPGGDAKPRAIGQYGGVIGAEGF